MNFKKKLENFIYYYKWHVIIGIFLIVLLIFGIRSFMQNKEPDMYILYASNKYVADDASKKLEKALEENNLLKDVNDDGQKYFLFDPNIMSFEKDNQDMAVLQKFQTVMMVGTQDIMLLHQYAVEDYGSACDDLIDYAKDTDKTIKGTDGDVRGISVEGNEFLESCGIKTDNLYISLFRRTNKDKQRNTRGKEFEQAYKTIEFILSKNPEKQKQ